MNSNWPHFYLYLWHRPRWNWHRDALLTFTISNWVVAQHVWIAAQPWKHILSLLCFLLLGCQQSGSSQHGGDRGLCQGTDGGDWAGGQSGQRGRRPRGGQQPNLWPWLGGNEQNPDAGFFSFFFLSTTFFFFLFCTGTNSAAPKRKDAPAAQYLEKMEGGQLLHFLFRCSYVLVLEHFRLPRFPLLVFSSDFWRQYDDEWLFNSTSANTIPSNKVFIGYQGND